MREPEPVERKLQLYAQSLINGRFCFMRSFEKGQRESAGRMDIILNGLFEVQVHNVELI